MELTLDPASRPAAAPTLFTCPAQAEALFEALESKIVSLAAFLVPDVSAGDVSEPPD